jgi:hypothetical protein
MKVGACVAAVVLTVLLCSQLAAQSPPDEKLDIVLLPSHYYGLNAGANPQWTADAEAFKERLWGHHFWSGFRSKMNFHRVDVSTADDFYVTPSSEYWVPDQTRIKEFAVERVPSLDFEGNDQIIFIVESEAYANDPLRTPNIGITRGDPNILTIESSRINSLAHEFGHSFGGLGDEYGSRVSIDIPSRNPNIASDHDGDTCDDKWGDLIGLVIEAPGTWIEDAPHLRTVGCHLTTLPPSAATWYRPTLEACIMNQINDRFPFCPVCARHLESLMSRYAP